MRLSAFACVVVVAAVLSLCRGVVEVCAQDDDSGESVRVRVVDVEGKPVAGAEVAARRTPVVVDRPWMWPGGETADLDRVWASKPPGWDETIVASATTDTDGVVAIALPSDVRFDVTATAPGFAVRGASVLRRAGRRATSMPAIVLDRGHVVSGSVRSEDGDPIADALVLVRYAALGHARWADEERPLRATTNSRGAFRIEGVPAGEATLFAAPRGTWFERMHVVRVTSDPVEIRLPLRRLRAVVHDAVTGTPVPGAEVLLEARGWHHSDTTLRATTDREGRVDSLWPSRGVSGGRVRAQGYLGGLHIGPSMGGSVDLEDRSRDVVELEIVPSVEIRGIVRGPRGPVEGALVAARPKARSGSGVETVRSGPDGAFALRVAEGTYHVAAARSRSDLSVREADEALASGGDGVLEVGRSGRSGVVVALREPPERSPPEPTGIIEGTVEGPDGSVPDRAMVTTSDGGHGATTDSLGRFLIENVAPGTYDLSLSSFGSGEPVVLRGVRVEAAKSTAVVLGTDSGPSLRVKGRVEAPEGAALADAWVTVGGACRHPVRADGSFEFPCRPRTSSAADVSAYAPGLLSAHASRPWAGDEEAVTDVGVLRLEGPRRIRVVAAESREPLATAQVRLEFVRTSIACGSFEDPVDERRWRADRDGWIAIDADVFGEDDDRDPWRVVVSAPGRLEWHAAARGVDGAVALPIPASLRGRVRFPDGAPARGAVVEVGPGWSSPFSTAGRREGRTDAEGGIGFEGLCAGPNEVRISSGAGGDSVALTEWEDVEVPATGREFVVERALTIEGRVVDVRGRPLADVSVDAEFADEESDRYVEDVRTDAHGRFRLVGVLPGPWKLSVRYDGLLTVAQDVAVEAGARDVEITADVGHRLRGRLVGADGAPLAGRRVALRKPSDVVAGPFEQETETGPDGRFELGALLRGAYSVRLGSESDDLVVPPEVSIPVADDAEVTFVRAPDETR